MSDEFTKAQAEGVRRSGMEKKVVQPTSTRESVWKHWGSRGRDPGSKK